MPTYGYKCRQCGNEFEELRLIDERAIPTESPCSICGGEVYQEFFALGLSFRGEVKRKPDSRLNDRLKEIKKKFPGNKINIIE